MRSQQQQPLCHCDSRAALNESPAVASSEEAAEALRRPLEAAVHTLLLGVGEDPTREGLVDTPRVRQGTRIARGCELRRHRSRPPLVAAKSGLLPGAHLCCPAPTACSAWPRRGWT